MTNLAMEIALKERGIDFVRAKVGDAMCLSNCINAVGKSVARLLATFLCMDKHNTGDGIISALQVFAALGEMGVDLNSVLSDWQAYPQTMINVRINKGHAWQPAAEPVLKQVEQELGQQGRVVLHSFWY